MRPGRGAVARFALTRVEDATFTNFPVALTANIDVAAVLQKAVAAGRSAGAAATGSVLRAVAKNMAAAVDLAATVLRPFNIVRTLTAGADVAASVLRAVGKPLVAGVDVSAAVSNKALAKALAAAVDVTATATKSIVLTVMTASVDVAGLALKNIGKPLRAAVSVVATLYEGAFNIISRRILQNPVDYYMEGLPQYRNKYRSFERSTAKGREDVTVKSGKRGRIGGDAPTFTTRTDKKGYD